MPGFGFGFGSQQSSVRNIALSPSVPLPILLASAQWNGTAGSGFSTFPIDPVRSTAKPTLRLIVPPNQFFTDELLVGVVAGANDGGTLVSNMGLKRVEVHCEGITRTIDAPSFQTFADVNGTYRTYFGWWTLLRHDGRNGHIHVYFEAVPNDATMQNRVIGPHQFSPQPKLHDVSIKVAASGGADFQTIAAALDYFRTSGFNNPLMTITEAGDYDIADGIQAYEGQGYCTIAASVSGVRIAKTGYSTDAAAAIRSRYAGLRFRGSNLTIDTKHISEIYSESGATRFHWMDGCTVTNSAGQGALWRGVTRPVDWIVRNGGWFTECLVENCGNAFSQARLVRGTTEVDGTRDLYTACAIVVGNVSSGHRSDTTLAKDIPAISVRYSGAAATATFELAGTNALSTRTVTVKVAGSADKTFTLQKSEAAYQAGTNYSLQNLVSWLNTIPGVSATLLDTSSGRAAGWLSLTGLEGSDFTARDIKAAPLALVTYIDVVSSWWQDANPSENVIQWGNIAVGMVARDFNLGGSGSKRDFLIANNAIHNDKNAAQSAALLSQFDGANSHVVCAHNTLSTQSVTFRTDSAYSSDNYNLFANNSVRKITWASSAATTPIVNNHIHTGQTAPASVPGQTNVSGTSIGGDSTNLYASDTTGDFRATGALISNPVATVLAFNGKGEALSAIEIKGAYKASPQETFLTASSVTQYGITYTFSETQAVAQYPTGDWRVLGPVSITSITPASTQASGVYLDDPAAWGPSWVHGATRNPGNRSWTPGGLIATNKGNQSQGLNQVPSITGYGGTPYSHSANQDPGATGVPLDVSTGTVMKFVSRDGQGGRGAPYKATRPGGLDMAVLTVVDDLGAANALRPGVPAADTSHHFIESDWDLSIFNNFAKPSAAPTAAAAIAAVQRAFALQFTDSVNSENAHAYNNHPSYGREIAKSVHTTALALHCDYTSAEKIAMLNGLYGLAIDTHERMIEGGDCQVPSGGGNGWKKSVLCIVRAALRNASATAKLAEMAAICNAQQNFGFAEDKQIREVTAAVIATPREYLLGRALDPYVDWMEGAYDFTSGGTTLSSGGTNWSAPYRDEFGSGAFGGALAVMMTTGARALWNRDPLFQYWTTFYHTEQRLGFVGPGGTNQIPTFHGQMAAAYWPTDPVAPSLVSAKVDTSTLWLGFDKNLDETEVVALGDYTVKVNGTPVSGITRAVAPLSPYSSGTVWVPNGIFRDRVGLKLPSPVASSAVVTISYAGGSGANKLRSVLHNVNVAAFTDRPVQNLTPSLNGINASYPIVRFNSANPDQYRPSIAVGLGSDAPRWTLWMPHIKLFATPTGTVEIFGFPGASPTFEIQILNTRAIKVIPRNSSGSIITQISSTPLALNTAYSVRFDFDATDPSSTTGWNVYLNGSLAKGSTNGWPGTPTTTVGWSRTTQYILGGTAAPYFDGEFGGLWLNTTERVTDPAQVAKFTSVTGGSLDIGTLGDGVTGSPPRLFFVGNADQYNDPSGFNRGTGAKFFRTSGGVVDLSQNQANQWR